MSHYQVPPAPGYISKLANPRGPFLSLLSRTPHGIATLKIMKSTESQRTCKI